MRTLVVFSALAAVALAAPALLEEGSEDFKKIITNVPEVFKRERQATQEPSFSSNPTPEAPANLPSTSQISDFGVSGRSFGLKKPIIIKKKQGYHVYRDSDDEQAESGEMCGKQVKVKVCDEKSEEKMRSSNVEDTNILTTEKDVKNNIQLAKESIQNLLRDLNNVERKPGTKMTLGHHGNSQSDAEIHKNIEVARGVLEHIYKDIENMEPFSLHATALDEDVDIVHNAQFVIGKTEEQRLAQWKEAIDTIQENVEIAKNIEDSFKATPGETGLLFADDTAVPNTKHKSITMTDHFKRTTGDMVIKDENCQIDHEHEKSSEKDGELMKNDMMPSASTISEKKIKDLHDSKKAIHASGLSTEIQVDNTLKTDKSVKNILKETNVDTGSMISKDFAQNHNLVSESMKTMDENKEMGTVSELNDKKLQKTESTDSAPSFPKKIKSAESDDMLLEEMRNAEATPMTQSTKFIKFEELETPEKKHPEIKSAEDFDEHHSNLNMNERKTQDQKQPQSEQAKEVDTAMLMKSAQQSPTNTQKELLTDDTKIHENNVQKDNLAHHFTEAKMDQRGGLNQEIVKHTNNAEHHHHKPSSLHQIREADDLIHKHQHQLMSTSLVDPTQTRWATDKNLHLQIESMKSADNFNSPIMNQELQNVGHLHHQGHAMKSHHFDTPNGHGQLLPRFPDNIMPLEKSADADVQSYYMSMREGSALGPDGHRFRWKPTHEASRSAYGAPAGPAPASSSSGDAVGVFPNAKISNCGIPLLLSCNPSVMTGSLAKPQPAPYSTPAYRTEDNFHTKREVKKTEENQHRTPANVNLKSSTVLVAKQ